MNFSNHSVCIYDEFITFVINFGLCGFNSVPKEEVVFINLMFY